MKNHRSGRMMEGGLFSLYMLVFLLTENAVNQCAGGFAQYSVSMVYALGLGCTAGGYLLFALSRRLVLSEKGRRGLLLVVGGVFGCSVGIFFRAQSAGLFLCFGLLALLSFGYMGGMAHYCLSMRLQDGTHTGRTVGIAVGCAALMQYGLENLFRDTVGAYLICVCLCLGALAYAAVRLPADWMPEKDTAPEHPLHWKELLIPAAAILLMSLIVSVNDSILTELHAKGAMNVLAWPRLVYAVSVCGAGFLADIRKRKYMGLATVCAMLLSVLAFTFCKVPPPTR